MEFFQAPEAAQQCQEDSEGFVKGAMYKLGHAVTWTTSYCISLTL